MLAGWAAAGVDQADLAVRRPDGAMLWQRSRALGLLPMAWLRAANVACAEVYIRPARGGAWPLLFLDDVAVTVALEVLRCHGGLAVQTSPAGGCHLWLPCTRPLEEADRCRAQRWLAQRFGADPASVSGEHLGRLAGFKNWKRSGCWVNVLDCRMDPAKALDIPQQILAAGKTDPSGRASTDRPPSSNRVGGDTSPSGVEWGWVCRMLEAGMDPDRVIRELVTLAWSRRGEDSERYARRTVEKAMVKVGRSAR
jgi:hypothetical protein